MKKLLIFPLLGLLAACSEAGTPEADREAQIINTICVLGPTVWETQSETIQNICLAWLIANK